MSNDRRSPPGRWPPRGDVASDAGRAVVAHDMTVAITPAGEKGGADARGSACRRLRRAPRRTSCATDAAESNQAPRRMPISLGSPTGWERPRASPVVAPNAALCWRANCDSCPPRRGHSASPAAPTTRDARPERPHPTDRAAVPRAGEPLGGVPSGISFLPFALRRAHDFRCPPGLSPLASPGDRIPKWRESANVVVRGVARAGTGPGGHHPRPSIEGVPAGSTRFDVGADGRPMGLLSFRPCGAPVEDDGRRRGECDGPEPLSTRLLTSRTYHEHTVRT
jgi:hypothetical protein